MSIMANCLRAMASWVMRIDLGHHCDHALLVQCFVPWLHGLNWVSEIWYMFLLRMLKYLLLHFPQLLSATQIVLRPQVAHAHRVPVCEAQQSWLASRALSPA